MWDLLVLTAANEKQKSTFLKQLNHLDLREYCKNVDVVSDANDKCRIGSGGSTIQVIQHLIRMYNNSLKSMKILLCHSGGLSQRMPHLSAYGKAFGYLPNGMTILENKLRHYL
ncbi:unnamed protein product [Caenorhabditis bovis]|uniref:GDP-fucose pyrophosphorylase domain-containing protein n=1 Tax=Caenorhabditis bovis TaxID=2654633 RepID=A0A8S1ELP3_9PELO|nr:unnamed protein product [Caenorhabditis bovis]